MGTNYEKYLKAIEEENNRETPVYVSTRQADIDALISEIKNSKYSYDQGSDPKAANATRAYTAASQRAMRDTLGTASAMTGGRPSSYAQSAAQQAYSRQMEGLNTYLDQLETLAFQRYESNLAKKQNDLAILKDQENADYTKFQQEQAQETAKRKNNIDYLYQLAQIEAQNEQTEKEAAAKRYAAALEQQTKIEEAKLNKQKDSYAIYKEIDQNSAEFTDIDDLYDYLSGMVGSGYLTQDQMDSIYSKYRTKLLPKNQTTSFSKKQTPTQFLFAGAGGKF